jgi:hypothetical protein
MRSGSSTEKQRYTRPADHARSAHSSAKTERPPCYLGKKPLTGVDVSKAATLIFNGAQQSRGNMRSLP